MGMKKRWRLGLCWIPWCPIIRRWRMNKTVYFIRLYKPIMPISLLKRNDLKKSGKMNITMPYNWNSLMPLPVIKLRGDNGMPCLSIRGGCRRRCWMMSIGVGCIRRLPGHRKGYISSILKKSSSKYRFENRLMYRSVYTVRYISLPGISLFSDRPSLHRF